MVFKVFNSHIPCIACKLFPKPRPKMRVLVHQYNAVAMSESRKSCKTMGICGGGAIASNLSPLYVPLFPEGGLETLDALLPCCRSRQSSLLLCHHDLNISHEVGLFISSSV